MESLQEDLSVSTQLFSSLQAHCNLYKLENPGDTLTIFVKELEKLTESIQSAIRNTWEVEYSILQQKVADFQSMVTESEVFREYSRDKIMRPYSGSCMGREIAKVEEDKRMMDDFLRMSEIIKDAYEKRKQNEMEKFEREWVQRCENKIEEMKKEIMKEIEFKKQVEGQLEAVILERKILEKELDILMNQFKQKKKQQEENFGNPKIKFHILCFQETGNDLDLYKDLRLDLDYRNKNIINLTNKMNQENLNMPNIKRLNFENPPKDDQELLNFLCFWCPDKLDLFCFNNINLFAIPLDYYSAALTKCLPNVKREVYIKFCNFSQKWFELIVKSSAKCQRLSITSCTIDGDEEYDFSGPKFVISYLNLRCWGCSAYNKWESNPHRFENIIKGISKSGLKDSLKKLNIYDCDIEKDKVEEVLDQYGLKDKIIVVEEIEGPLKE
jgi:hypothetical protein